MIDAKVLSQIKLFQDVPADKLALIEPLLMRCNYSKGDYIIREDTFGDEMYLLCEGTVIVSKELVKGVADMQSKEKVLATLKADYYPTFGENGLLGHGARTANVIAQTDCVLCVLSKADFYSFASQNLEAAYTIMLNIARILSARLHDTDNNLVKLATAFYIAVQR